MKRRDFIKNLPIGVAAASIPFSIGGFNATAFARNPALDALLNPQSDNGKILVLINLNGGNDGLNTVIPYHDDLYTKTHRKNIGFSSDNEKLLLDKTALSATMALNPMFQSDTSSPKMYDMWEKGNLAIVQNVGYNDSNRSHFRSTDIWNTATDSTIIMSTGWLGRYLENEEPQYPFDVVEGDDPLAVSIDFSSSLAFQGSKISMGIAVADPSDYKSAVLYTDEPTPATNYGDELGYVRNILIQSDLYGRQFDKYFPPPPASKPTNNVVYPTGNSLAQQLKKVAWCISKGMKTKVYFVSQGGYDTHVQQNSKDNQAGQGRLLFELAEAISLFQEDIEKFGVADKVLGMTYSEFGRRVNENGSAGTDHGTCAPQFLFGEGVNGGLYGRDPDLTPYNPNDSTVGLDNYSDLRHQFDFRQLYSAVLTEWFGATEEMTKAVLNKSELTTHSKFDIRFPENGTGQMKSLFKPQTGSTPSNNRINKNFILQQNYPNPAISETQIPLHLAETSFVKMDIFNSKGEMVTTAVNSTLGKGEHLITVNTRMFASGSYYYRAEINGVVETLSMRVVR